MPPSLAAVKQMGWAVDALPLGPAHDRSVQLQSSKTSSRSSGPGSSPAPSARRVSAISVECYQPVCPRVHSGLRTIATSLREGKGADASVREHATSGRIGGRMGAFGPRPTATLRRGVL